jgi:hypothetical protein
VESGRWTDNGRRWLIEGGGYRRHQAALPDLLGKAKKAAAKGPSYWRGPEPCYAPRFHPEGALYSVGAVGGLALRS